MIAALALLAALLAAATLASQAKNRQEPPSRASTMARIQDLPGGLQQGLGLPTSGQAAFDTMPTAPWDRALGAIQLAERQEMAKAREWALGGNPPPGPHGAAFRLLWEQAYLGTGSAPSDADLPGVQQALGGGWGAKKLAIRLQARKGEDTRALEQSLAQWTHHRLLGFAVIRIGASICLIGGLAFVGYLLFAKRSPGRTTPRIGMSGRALSLLLLGWFAANHLAALPALALTGFFPAARPYALPIQYALHAGFGVWLFAWAEGLTLRGLFRKLFPRPHVPALGLGAGYLALAVLSVFLVAALVFPWMPKGGEPQKELLQLMGGTQGWFPVLLLFLTVAGMAPLFEEIMFRGALTSWLNQTLEAPLGARRGRFAAAALSGLVFGLIHIQPLALPTLSTLGFVLGLAFIRSGNLWTSVIVHGAWNATVFLFSRLVS